MVLFLAVLAFWMVALFSAKSIYRKVRQRHLLEPARFLSEMLSVDYYRQLSAAQFETLILMGIRKRGYTLLGDPWLGRAKEQGYIWKKGTKAILVYSLYDTVTLEDLEDAAKKRKMARAEHVYVFYPFPSAPKSHHDGVEVLYGNKLLNWFSVLDDVLPPVFRKAQPEICECGAPMRERVSRAGQPLLVCSMYPDCRTIRAPSEPSGDTPPVDGLRIA